MHDPVIEVDYLIKGAGAAGMAFADSLVTDTNATIAIVDRYHRPGGHWNPGDEFAARLMQSIANSVEALATGESVDDVFARLEAFDEVRRIDPTVNPAGYHGGFVSDGELEQLRRIRNVVRLGRVVRIDADQIVLKQGSIPPGRRFPTSASGSRSRAWIPTLAASAR